MTTLQEVLFEMETAYLGHPYYVTGHALFNALAPRVDARTRAALDVSHGVFVPGEHGQYPEWHSQSGGQAYMGTGLHPVEAYEDLFLFRDPAHRWLSDDRPRDAHNAHDLQGYGGRAAFASACRFGQEPEAYHDIRTVNWYVHAYVTADDDADDVLPLDTSTVDGLQVGGARNYGFGELSVADTQTVDVAGLDYSGLAGHDEYVLDLISPYVLASEYPGADDQSVPWWWDAPDWGSDSDPDHDQAGDGHSHEPRMAAVGTDTRRLRRRAEQLVVGDDVHRLQTVDHGQIVEYAGEDPVESAINGIRRVGTHAKYGFGEFRIRPVDRPAPERTATVPGGGGAHR